MLTDPIADLLTRIRNANMASQDCVEVPASRIKANIVKVLQDEGYIKNFRLVRSGTKHALRFYLKPEENGKKVLTNLRRESRPGLRRYVGNTNVPRVLNGAGIVILSTSKGIMTGREAKQQKLGGELLCSVW